MNLDDIIEKNKEKAKQKQEKRGIYESQMREAAAVKTRTIENKANKALVEFFSKTFKVPKTKIEIIKGDTSKEKTILIKTTDQNKRTEIISRLTK